MLDTNDDIATRWLFDKPSFAEPVIVVYWYSFLGFYSLGSDVIYEVATTFNQFS